MSSTLVWLTPDGAAGASPLAVELGKDHRVGAAVSPQLDQFVLIGQSSGAAAALALAVASGEACAALVLMAPILTLPVKAVPDIPILLLLGTDDARVPPSAAGPLCAALPRAHPILIYGAGHALDRERVAAVAAVMRDFIARRDKFIVRDESDVLYP